MLLIRSLVFLGVLILSCAHNHPTLRKTACFKRWAVSGNRKKVIAILPFTNETRVEGVDRLVRKGIYEYFSIKPFQDVEIEEIDATIKMAERIGTRAFNSFPPETIGKLLKCDALLYGRIKRFERIFLLIYTQMLIEAEIRIVETRSGREV